MKRIILLILIFISGNLSRLFAQQPLGIDVSHHQGIIDWSLVYNAGKVFAFVKATEGYTYNDPRFVSNMQNGTQAGVWMGAYHFARPDNNTAISEAQHFVQIAGNFIGRGYLPPVLDLEDPPGHDLQLLYTSHELSEWVRTWLETVEQLTGVEPIIYTNGRYTQYLESTLTSYKLWIAEPDGNTNPPDNLNHWSDWSFKQYSWTGNVPGINGDVDLDVFNGTIAELESLIYPSALDCQNAHELSCQQVEHFSESMANSLVESYSCVSWNEPGPERLHRYIPSQQASLSVVISGYSGDLDVFVLDDCDPNACAGTAYESSFTSSPTVSGIPYYIIVDAKDGSGSYYDIFIYCGDTTSFHDFSVNNARVISGDTLISGNVFDVAFNTYYAGNSDTLIQVLNACYLSAFPQLDSSATILFTSHANLSRNQRQVESNWQLSLSDTISEGNYYLFFLTNITHTISEATNENNVMVIPVYISGSSSISNGINQPFIIYPNPTNNHLFIYQNNGKLIQNAALFDLSGKRIRIDARKRDENLWEISLENVHKGIYILYIIDKEGKKGGYKIIKK